MDNQNTKRYRWERELMIDMMIHGLDFNPLYDILPAAIKYCADTGQGISFNNDYFGLITVFKPREDANIICINPEGLKMPCEKTFVLEDYTKLTPNVNELGVRRSVDKYNRYPIELYYYRIGQCIGEIIELWYSFKREGNAQNVEEEKECDDKLGG